MDIKCCNCGAVGQEKADGVCTKERKLVVFNFRCFCAEKRGTLKHSWKRIASCASLLLPELRSENRGWFRVGTWTFSCPAHLPLLRRCPHLDPTGDPTHISVRGLYFYSRIWWNSGMSRWWREDRKNNVFYFLTSKHNLFIFKKSLLKKYIKLQNVNNLLLT